MMKKHNEPQESVHKRESNHAEERRFRELFNHIHSGVVIYEAINEGKDFIIKDFNPAAEIIEQAKKEDIIGRKVTDVFPGIKQMGLLDTFRKVWLTGNEEYHPITIYEDERLMGWRENHIYKLDSGEIVAIYEDQTEKKQIEEKMVWLASFPEVNPLIVVELDAENHVKYFNPTARKQFPDIEQADSSHPFFNQIEAAKKILNDSIINMAPVDVKCGDKWFTQIVCRISNNPNLRIYAYDVTENKRAEAKRRILMEIAQASIDADDLKDFLRLVHQSISKVMYAKNFFTVLYNKESGLFEEVYTVDQYDHPAPPSKLEKSVTAYVFRCKKPLLMDDVLYRDLIARGEVKKVGKECPSWLGVPLKIGQETVGVMVVQDYETENRYSQDDLDFLLSIGGDVAKVVERKRAEAKIRESEKRYHSLFEDSPISLWEEDFSAVRKKIDLWKKKGITNFDEYLEQQPEEVAECAKLVRILDVNKATMDLLRAKYKEDLLSNLSSILTEETADEFRSELVQIAEGKNHFEWEGKNRTLSGELINVQLSWSVVPGYEKDLSKVLVSIMDITQRKKSEEEMRHLIQELRMLGELEKDNRILAETLAKNAVTINRTLQSDKILDAIIENLGAVIPYDTASIMLIKNDGAKIVRSKGFKERGLEEWVQSRIFFLNEYPNLATVFRTGNYVLISQVDKSPDWRLNKEMDWVQSAINAPLKEGEKVIGFLNIDSSIRDYYNESHARHLLLFTEQIATALKNAKLYEETQKRINRMQAMTQIDQAINSSLDLNISLEIILMQAKEQLRADAANILLVDEINQSLVFSKARGFKTDVIKKTNLRLGTGLPSAAVMERTVVQIPDLQTAEESFFKNALVEQEGFRSYYCAPLVTKGQLKGVIEVYFKQPFQADQEWLEFLGTLAQQSAIAINNAELLNSLQAGQFELVNAYENALQGWVQTYERQLGGEDELKRLTDFSMQLAEKMGMNRSDLANFKRGVLLHDIGMTSIPAAIINKTEKISEAERQIIQAHPIHARSLLSKSKYMANNMDIPCHHHERWDGSGYPQGLMGEMIPLAARIFAVADVWVALTSDRPYRKAWSKAKAIKYILKQSGKQFDAQVVEAFFELVNKKTN